MANEQGLLANLSFSDRSNIAIELDELLENIEEMLGETKAAVRSMERALNRALYGTSG